MVIPLPRRGNWITKPKNFLVIPLPTAKVRKYRKNRRKTERFCPFMATILWYYQLGATLTLCPELIYFGLSARELCGLHENCILSARGYSNLQPYRTKNSEFLLQNRKTFVTLLREFYFFGNENKLYAARILFFRQ